MPELPDVRRVRFCEEYALGQTDAVQLTANRELADYYEATVRAGGDARLAANWVTGELAGALNREGMEIGQSPVSAMMLGGLLQRISDNTISGKIAKQVFDAMWGGGGSADEIIQSQGLKQITDSGALEEIVNAVVDENRSQVDAYRQADEKKQAKMLGFFVGRVMQASKGKANPKQVNELLRRKLAP
ncbi:MAG TPA: Asp-tRNA(Asn)/Glu-tRNA(Gln) amidotransferase GatCAB subunit B, partial [Gammaproteobacteria bacterium]|nr:Asp-tRNA(Asn)/Glu-tRNA(Gln) amidotransferase GatCAB subunit B [Gammaproteobacteria bacterium]